jgi:hypothetical protein
VCVGEPRYQHPSVGLDDGGAGGERGRTTVTDGLDAPILDDDRLAPERPGFRHGRDVDIDEGHRFLTATGGVQGQQWMRRRRSDRGCRREQEQEESDETWVHSHLLWKEDDLSSALTSRVSYVYTRKEVPPAICARDVCPDFRGIPITTPPETTIMSRFETTILALFTAVLLGAAGVQAQEGDFLWRVETVRAAPGMLAELMDLYEEQADANGEVGDGEMVWMRHSQGDQWDLMMMFPMGSFGEYYGESRVAARASVRTSSGRTGAELQWAIDAATSEREDLFVRGPAPDAVMERYADAGLFHIEMFVALHDKRDELLAQRRMENAYYTHLGRRTNMIFVREAGAPWDMFTLGFHPSLLAFAQAGDIPAERQNAAATAAGFESVNTIGTYLRSLMLRHSDTLANRAGNRR